MNSTRSILLGLLLLAAPAALKAQFIWRTNSDGVSLTISGYRGTGGTVTFPSQIDGIGVSAIGDGAFRGSLVLTNVTIPGSIATIEGGEGAFSDCANLASVVMLAGVADIGESSFSGCRNLTNVVIPSTVTNIDVDACSQCGNLANVAFSVGLVRIGGGAFSDCGNLGNVNLPDGLTTIGVSAFWHSSIATLTIPGSVTDVGQDAFQGCWKLTSVTISNGVTNIAAGMFGLCTSLTNVTIPGSVTDIATVAFSMCSSLQSVMLPAGLNDIGSDAFYMCNNLTNVTFPSGVRIIEAGAFNQCNLASVTIPSSVTNIGGDAFAGDLFGAQSLTNVFFEGNAPGVGGTGADGLFVDNPPELVVYYLTGTTGWTNFAAGQGVPMVLWNPQIQTNDANFGVKDNQFGFDITGTTNIPIVVEATTNLASPEWTPLQSLALTNGLSHFTDPQWTNYPARYYRITHP